MPDGSQARLPVRGRSTTGAACGWGGSGAAGSAGSASSGCAGSVASLSPARAGTGAATISGALACMASTEPGCAAADTGAGASGSVRAGPPELGRTRKRASASAAVSRAPPNVTVPASPSCRERSGGGEPEVVDGWARPVDIGVLPNGRGCEQLCKTPVRRRQCATLRTAPPTHWHAVGVPQPSSCLVPHRLACPGRLSPALSRCHPDGAALRS